MADDSTVVDFPFFAGPPCNDRPRQLRFHYNEFLELENRTGKTPMEFVANIMKLSATDLRLALWVGLKWQEPAGRKLVTQEWVGQQLQKLMANGKSFMPLLRALDEAFSASGYFTPEAAEDVTANPTGDGSSDSRPTPATLRAVGDA